MNDQENNIDKLKEDVSKLKEYFYPGGEFVDRGVSTPYVRKNHPEVYEKVKDDYRPKLYMLLHDMSERPRCANPSCDNEVGFKDMKWGFRKTCSKKCLGEYQSQDKELHKKIHETISKANEDKLKNDFPDLSLKLIRKPDYLYYEVSDYCEHSPFLIKYSIFHTLHRQDVCLCQKCKDSTYENYEPTRSDIDVFLKEFPKFYADNNNAIKRSWLLTHHPKKLKIIETYTTSASDASLAERMCMFKNGWTSRSLCPNCNANELKFVHSKMDYAKFCSSLNCQMNVSTMELEMRDFLDECGLKHETHVVISTIDKEGRPCRNNYDFKVGNLLIEMNGLYWHGDQEKSDRSHHYNRLVTANEAGCDLLTIWEDDWSDKKDRMKDLMRKRFGLCTDKIKPEDCGVVALTEEEAATFLNENHVEGHAGSDVNLGLMHCGKLVSVMTFGHAGDGKYELLRFCDALGTSVGESSLTLWDTFLKENSPSEVFCWQNLDHQVKHAVTSELARMGFEETDERRAECWYAKARKKWCEPEDLSESEMKERRLYRIWPAGKVKHTWKKKKK